MSGSRSWRFESAGTMVLGRARVKRAPVSRSALLPWLGSVLLLLLVAAAAGALWLALDDRFYVYSVDVTGTVRVSPDDVYWASGMPGLHVLWVRPAEIEARILAAKPTLKSARVVCEPLAKCTITVVERQPRMMWNEDGQLWWIDADGIIFPAQEVLLDGWLVRGPLPRDEDGCLDESVRVALRELWATGASVSPSLDYVPGRGLVLTDERGWRAVVGQGPGMLERLQVLEWLAADLEGQGLTPRFVDVRFPNAPYYSLSNDW